MLQSRSGEEEVTVCKSEAPKIRHDGPDLRRDAAAGGEAAERCGASVKADDAARTGCNATLRVALSRKRSLSRPSCFVPVCSRITAKIRHAKPDLRPCRPAGGERPLPLTVRRTATSSSHPPEDKAMKLLNNFQSGLWHLPELSPHTRGLPVTFSDDGTRSMRRSNRRVEMVAWGGA
ncbi:MAG: hypothetical protein AAGA21_14785 [Pseudomonadota bacterium]